MASETGAAESATESERFDPAVLADVADVDRVLERADDEQLLAALERRDDGHPFEDSPSNSV